MPRRDTTTDDKGRVQVTYRMDPALRDELHGKARERAVHPQLMVAAAVRFYLDHLPPVEDMLAATLPAPPAPDPAPVASLSPADEAARLLELTVGDPDKHVCDCGHERGVHELVASARATLHVCRGEDATSGPPCMCARFRFNHAPNTSALPPEVPL